MLQADTLSAAARIKVSIAVTIAMPISTNGMADFFAVRQFFSSLKIIGMAKIINPINRELIA